MHVTFKRNGLESWFLVQMNRMDSKIVPGTKNPDQLVGFGCILAKTMQVLGAECTLLHTPLLSNLFSAHTHTLSWPQLSTLSAFSQRCLIRRALLQWIEWIVTVAEVYCMKQNSCESLSCQGTWIHMIGPTLERSHSVAQSVTRVSYIQVTWRNMKEPTQEKSHSNALSVTRASQDQVTWRHMIGLI